jgi:regulator of extracellular matrix RemA (YlzA/DUF370 family)
MNPMTRIRAIEAAIAKREAQAARDNREVVVANQKTAAEILAEDIRKIHSSYRPEALADVLKQKTGSNSNGSSNGHAV